MKILKIISFIFLLTALMAFTSCSLLEMEDVNTSDANIVLYGENPYDVYDGSANSCDGNDDNDVNQGESVRLNLRIQNSGTETGESISMTISTTDAYAEIVSGAVQSFGDVSEGQIAYTPDANSSSSILVSIDQGTPDGHTVNFNVTFKDKDNNKWEDSFNFIVKPISASIGLYATNPYDVYDGTSNSCNGNDDGKFNVAETCRVQLRVANSGSGDALGVSMEITVDDDSISLVGDSVYTYTLGDIGSSIEYTPDADGASSLIFGIARGTQVGHSATFNVVFTDKYNNTWTDDFDIEIVANDASVGLYGTNPYDIYDGTSNGCSGNDDDEVNAGETCRIQLRVSNTGTSDAIGVNMDVTSTDQYITMVSDTTYAFGDIESNIKYTPDANGASGICFEVDSGAPSNHTAEFTVTFTDDFGNEWTDTFDVIIY